MKVVAEGPPSSNATLVSVHWDPKGQRLFGAAAAGDALQLHSLAARGDGSWAWGPPRTVAHAPAKWNTLGGNAATASAFDAASRKLFLLAGRSDPQSGDVAYDLATIDVNSAAVLAHPPLGPVGMPGCASCLEALAI